MCGIACIAHSEIPLGEDERLAMNHVLQGMSYRGPDAAGTWQDARVLLGHRRLSIIDLSEAGNQPLHDPQTGTHIVFNGEIFNYAQLREELKKWGYRFTTSTDTEVILASYARYGKRCVERLNGMFAFILYDGPRNKLILCRDRMGKKPLYYHLDSKRLVALSEIKFFHAIQDMPLDLDLESVRAFFALQYIPGPHTVYRSIRKVSPGHWLELDLASWQAESHRYWSVDRCFSSSSSTHSMEELDSTLEESVRLRLVSDVEMGILLSGGIDSSLLAFYATRLAEAPLKGFVVRFDEQPLDESPFARRVAQALGMPLVELDGGAVDADLLQRVIYHGDEPLGDPACIPTYLVFKEIARHVKVILSGEGADELFWGYGRYQREMLFQMLSPLLPRQLFDLDSLAFHGLEEERRPWIGLSRLAKVLSISPEFGCARWATVFGEPTLSRLMKPSGQPDQPLPRYAEALGSLFHSFRARTSPLEASIATDLAFWLPDDLLAKVDRMSMAHSVEARAPFLAHPVVQIALRMRPDQKADLKETKIILRRLLAQKLSPAVAPEITRRPKHGFDVPLNRWLTRELRDVAEDAFSTHSLQSCPFLSASYARRLWTELLGGSKSLAYQRKIWLLLCFLLWHRLHRLRFRL